MFDTSWFREESVQTSLDLPIYLAVQQWGLVESVDWWNTQFLDKAI